MRRIQVQLSLWWYRSLLMSYYDVYFSNNIDIKYYKVTEVKQTRSVKMHFTNLIQTQFPE